MAQKSAWETGAIAPPLPETSVDAASVHPSTAAVDQSTGNNKKTVSWVDRGPRRFPRAVFALRIDPRFSWCMHVPDGFAAAPEDYKLVVAVHGSSRNMLGHRDGYKPHAELHKWVVLVPLFPIGVLGDGNPAGYSMLIEGDIRYDKILLAMIAEFEEVLGVHFSRFGLTGYSAGGQFVHRFLYVHPELLWGVSIGAPGGFTLLDDRFDYWLGTRDWKKHFGAPIDIEAIRGVPIQLVCGDQDLVETAIPPAIATKLGSALGNLGRNRVERIPLLLKSYENHKLNVRLNFVPGVGHDGLRCLDTAAEFLSKFSSESSVATATVSKSTGKAGDT